MKNIYCTMYMSCMRTPQGQGTQVPIYLTMINTFSYTIIRNNNKIYKYVYMVKVGKSYMEKRMIK